MLLAAPRALHSEMLGGDPRLVFLRADLTQPAVAGFPARSALVSAVLARPAFDASHPAIQTPSAQATYGWLAGAIRAAARIVAALPGFRAGERVVLLARNSPEYVAAYLGILEAGGVAVPIPPETELPRLQVLFAKCRPVGVLADEFSRARVSPEFSGWLGEGSQEAPIENVDSPAVILFTSGSTGDPKGVVLSQRNLLANAQSIRQYLTLNESERALVLLPFYHAFGNSILTSHLIAGGTLILDGNIMFPESVLELIDAHQATSLSGVPEVFGRLLSYSTLPTRPLPSLRYMSVAGGSLNPEATLAMHRALAPAKFVVMYGQTEGTARLSYLPPEELPHRAGSIGKGIPGVTLRVADEHGQPVTQGTVGELLARGDNIMLGYWNDPEGTAQVLREGWLHTGDLAQVDEDGFIHVVGRKSALIKRAGYRLHPVELETFVRSRCGVQAVAAVSFPRAGDPGLAVFIEGDPARIPASEILGICQRELPRFKVPEHVEVLEQFPVTSATKIDRPALSERARAACSKVPAPHLRFAPVATR